jgi:DNA-directed RNA polymerase specialized sigma24 family protein
MTPHEVTVTTQSDAAVIAASLGRPSEFAEIFDRHLRTIHRYVARRVGRELADDIGAQCFTLAFEHQGGFRTDADTARPWLLGIATNLVREHWRAERRQLETAARLGRERLVDARQPATRDADPELSGALATLDQDQLDVLDQDQRAAAAVGPADNGPATGAARPSPHVPAPPGHPRGPRARRGRRGGRGRGDVGLLLVKRGSGRAAAARACRRAPESRARARSRPVPLHRLGAEQRIDLAAGRHGVCRALVPETRELWLATTARRGCWSASVRQRR